MKVFERVQQKRYVMASIDYFAGFRERCLGHEPTTAVELSIAAGSV
jgi:hypothetical protein